MPHLRSLPWLIALCACSSAGNVSKVQVSALEPRHAEQTRELLGELSAHASLDAQTLRARHSHERNASLGYDPRTAQGLFALQRSTHAVSDAELSALGEQGFVISEANQFPTMLYAYASFYVQDLPLYVTADSILDAVYRAYDALLRDVEENLLIQDLSALIAGMRERLPDSAARAEVVRDVDLYLAVAQGLVQDQDAAGVSGAARAEIAALTTAARQAKGHAPHTLFGAERDLDFSQLEPRGHYRDTSQLAQYFRALRWLGAGELRLIETLPSGERVFQRRQLEAAVLLHELVQGELRERHARIALTQASFVGERDAMDLPDLDALRTQLGLASWDALATLDDARIAQAILDGDYGTQRIASQLLQNRSADGRPLPLSRAFALLGPRYTVDGHVMSNLVHDVVPGRLMPSPLDAAYAAFGNDSALELLGPELDRYAGVLEATRELVDLHDAPYWQGSLYLLWLRALRALSPNDATRAAQPALTRTAAWDARILDTQLAAWAQLRHAAGLYAKPSYTVGLLCEYPDAYVEPYPDFFAALRGYGERGLSLAAALAASSPPLATRLETYFQNLVTAMDRLGDMARAELEGRAFSAEQLAFINAAVRKTDDCPGPPTFDGWYAQLDYGAADSHPIESHPAPLIVDIHTQPTDLAGRDVGRILHIATGLPRLMIVTQQTCTGARAYAGVVASYRELVTDDWQRLDDASWAERVLRGEDSDAEPSWSQTIKPH